MDDPCAICGDVSVGKTPDGVWLCERHANEREAALMAASSDWFGYLSSDGSAITTWLGGHLACVTRADVRRVGFGGSRVYWRAVAPDGSRWYGTSPGRGMFARMRRAR